MAGVVQKKYAEALYQMAIEHDKVDKITEEVKVVKKIMNEQKDLMKVLYHPQVNQQAKMDIVKNIFNQRISEELIGMIIITIEKKRQGILDKIFDEYINLVRRKKNISIANVTSAIKLSDEYIRKIHDKLKQTLNKEVEINAIIDRKVIGGLRIQLDNTVFDRTIKNKIENLRNVM
ncbi:MAG TPA: ATP synthase F1 subunit delta [Clostridiales bacterium]|nr:ATP synthase F1 subunit delta [Clostridiales bacterium]